jgi:hypothetical protein
MVQASRLGSGQINLHAPFSLQVIARTARGSQAMTLSGQGPYDLTAKIAAYAARRILDSTSLPEGVLAPSQCLDPQEFLAHAEKNWEVKINDFSLPT